MFRNLIAAVFGLALAGMVTGAQGATFYALETFDNNLYQIDTDTLGSPQFIGTIGTGAGPDLSELIYASPTTLYSFDRNANTLQTISSSDATVLSTVGLDVDVSVHPRASRSSCYRRSIRTLREELWLWASFRSWTKSDCLTGTIITNCVTFVTFLR